MKNIRTILLISIAMVVVSIGFISFMLLANPEASSSSEPADVAASEDEGPPPWIIITFVLVITFVSFLPFRSIIFPTKIKDGITAQANILKVWDTGTSINDNPQVGLLLEVNPPTGAPFQTEGKTIVSRLNVSLVQPGTTAEIIYDPKNPKRVQVVTINVDALSAETSTAARLQELESLRDKDLLTEEEYRTKRQQIINDL